MAPRMNGSSEKPFRLSLKSAKPALLNAETAWKTPSQSARPNDSSCETKRRAARTVAPIASNARLVRATPRSTRRTSPSARFFVSALVFRRMRNPSRRDTRSASSVASAMIPMPPIWIRIMITTCPNAVQWSGVFTVVKPVTQSAEVAVNSASTKLALPSSVLATGNTRSSVPTARAAANPDTTTWAGCPMRGARTRSPYSLGESCGSAADLQAPARRRVCSRAEG